MPDGSGSDDDCFYIALFSALEQTHCARMRFYTSKANSGWWWWWGAGGGRVGGGGN